MANFSVKTKGGANPRGKARVYFTCHPDDFGAYFEKLTDDILSVNDCAVYYTEDMTEPLDARNRELDLEQFGVFAVPVTFKLLTQPNRAMQEDIAYAKAHNIPILPFMVEPDVLEFYEREENFGQRQFINPYADDATEIEYAEKLKKYLDAVLISAETADRIRAAFDAYVFLSYRKKDRAYANELMRLIHDIPAYRDVAVWYDEFLTPGENFEKNIQQALENSALFALLITPNVLEEKDGKPNFVMGQEYPTAKKRKKTVLPVVMQETDEKQLREKFKGLPKSVEPCDFEFEDVFVKALTGVATRANDLVPEHNFLIGLAYLDGIDVEINVDRAVQLMTIAAGQGLIEAMEKLFDIYREGNRVPLDYKQAAEWAEKRARACEKKYGKRHTKTLEAYRELGHIYDKLGDYPKAHEILLKLHKRSWRRFCKKDVEAIASLSALAYSYGQIGDWDTALEMMTETYRQAHKHLGSRHPYTLNALTNAAYAFEKKGRYKYAQNLLNIAFKRCYEEYGEDHELTVSAVKGLALVYKRLGKTEDALLGYQAAYEQSCRLYGEDHPKTMTALNDFALMHQELGQYDEALDLYQKAVDALSETLGEVHPHTLSVWGNIVSIYAKLGEFDAAREMQENLYALHCKVLGKDHPNTLEALNNLTATCYEMGDYAAAYDGLETLYRAYGKRYGKTDKKTQETKEFLARVRKRMNKY